MLILVVGAKGGIGTTTLAQHLCRQTNAVPLDAADGALAFQMAGPSAPVLDLGYAGVPGRGADLVVSAVDVEVRRTAMHAP